VLHFRVRPQELIDGSHSVTIPIISFSDVPMIERALRAADELPSNLV
jgi:hypothetical protein